MRQSHCGIRAARREGVTEPAVLLVRDHRQQSGMATPERVDCDVQGTSHAVLYQDNLLRQDGLADHAVKGFQEVGRILLPIDAHQHAVRGMRIEGLWIMGIQTLIQTHSLAPSGRGSKTDITAVIGSFCNRSTCGRHASPVLFSPLNEPRIGIFNA